MRAENDATFCCMHRHCMFDGRCRSDLSHVQREELEASAVSSEGILAFAACAAERAKHNLAPPLQTLADEEPDAGHRVRLPESLLRQAGRGHTSCQCDATGCCQWQVRNRAANSAKFKGLAGLPSALVPMIETDDSFRQLCPHLNAERRKAVAEAARSKGSQNEKVQISRRQIPDPPDQKQANSRRQLQSASAIFAMLVGKD